MKVYDVKSLHLVKITTNKDGTVEISGGIFYNYSIPFTSHPLYGVWRGIKQRCYNPKRHNYKWYGLKGIKLCKKWLKNPKLFIKWGTLNGYRQGLQIDRIDNDKNYEPINCRFVTAKQNIRNSSIYWMNRHI